MKYYFPEFKPVKKEIRIIGVDDSPFEKGQEGKILIVGTIHRGSLDMEGIVSSYITIDGTDATQRIAEMINRSRHKSQLQIIMLDGIAVGGFNVVDIKELTERTKLPVIVIMRKKPDIAKVKTALEHVHLHKSKFRLIEQAGTIREVALKEGTLYFQRKGISVEKAREVITMSVRRGVMPEPIRCSHIIASGIILGESRGRP